RASVLKWYEAATGRERAVLRLPGKVLALSPDGRTLAGTDLDTTQQGRLPDPVVVKLWDAWTGQERAALRAHTSTVVAMRFSPDGRTLATADSDGEIKLWPAAPYPELDEPPRFSTPAREPPEVARWWSLSSLGLRDEILRNPEEGVAFALKRA